MLCGRERERGVDVIRDCEDEEREREKDRSGFIGKTENRCAGGGMLGKC